MARLLAVRGLGTRFFTQDGVMHAMTGISYEPDRVFFPTPELEDGLPRANAKAALIREKLQHMQLHEFRKGDIYVLRMSGSGGFGPPAERIYSVGGGD